MFSNFRPRGLPFFLACLGLLFCSIWQDGPLYPEGDEREPTEITPVEREENRLGRERLGMEVLLYIAQGPWAVTGMSFMGILS